MTCVTIWIMNNVNYYSRDLISSLNNIGKNTVTISSVASSNPLTVSYLSFQKLFVSKTAMVFYPSANSFFIKLYSSQVPSSTSTCYAIHTEVFVLLLFNLCASPYHIEGNIGIFQKTYICYIYKLFIHDIYARACVMKMIERNLIGRGELSEEFLLKIIERARGLSLYELSRKAKWTIGRVDGTVRRLLNLNKVFIKVVEKNGRRVNLVYPIDQKPSNIVEVPSNLLRAQNPLWSNEAFIYALDNTTIGISGEELSDWNDISCFSSRIPIERAHEKTSLVIPEKFMNFYHLEEKHRTISVSGNNILVTISGNIVETKKYPS